MTRATREALLEVQAILHEAGWDREPIFEQRIEKLRAVFTSLIDETDLTLLLSILGKGVPVAEAGRALGLSPEEAERKFRDALGRLCAFTDAVEAQGYATRA